MPVAAKHTSTSVNAAAVWRPSSGTWLIRGGSSIAWGVRGDIPVAGNFRGTALADQVVFRPGNGTWYLRWQETSTPTPPPPPPPPSPTCDPAYPTVCIPPPPPDLDCGDITYRRFVVRQPDPHNFDADGDGIGCES